MQLFSCNTIIPLPFWHKLNYFSFCGTFKKLLTICAKILIKSKFQLWGLNHKPLGIATSNWASLNTLDYSITLTRACLLLYVTITCQKFQNKKTKCQN
jgi:hypothetical protein